MARFASNTVGSRSVLLVVSEKHMQALSNVLSPVAVGGRKKKDPSD
jgi:hypothetical protein